MKKRFLSTLLALCMVLALLPGTALAAKAGAIAGTNLSWTLDDNGVLSITGSGTMPDYHYHNAHAPWYASRNQITALSIGKGVANISKDAFYNCSNIKKIHYAGSVEEWCKMFVHVSNWTYLYCSDSTMTFAGSPNTFVIQAGNCAAYEASPVTWTLDSGGMLTFSGSGEMPNYNWHSMHSPWFPRRSFITGVTIKSGITSIGSDAFYLCSNIASISLPVSVTNIKDAFSGCKKIKTLNYAGTQAQWNQVTVNANNDQYLFGANVNMNFSTGPITRYTLTFNANGGTITGDTARLVAKGDAFGTLPTPTRTGYDFAGWFTAKTGGKPVFATTTATKNQTIYAQWSGGPAADTMTVTLDVNGGKALSASNKTRTVTKGEAYGTLPTPTRTGYKFDGWYTTKTGGTKVLSTTKVTKSANHTLYARWTKNRTYLVTLDPNGGDVFQDYAVVVNGTYYRNLPTPVYPGKHFTGWYTEKSGGTKITDTRKVSLTANQTLYAHWSTAAVKATKTQTGSWRITLPADCTLVLYSSNTAAAKASTLTIGSAGRTLNCTSMAALSNGTVRYRTSINGKTYWFNYSVEMSVN